MPRRIMILLVAIGLVAGAIAVPANATASDLAYWNDLPKGVDLFLDGALTVLDDIAFQGQVAPDKAAARDVLGNIHGVTDFLGNTTPGDVADYVRNFVVGR